MEVLYTYSMYFMAVLYIAAGINHFVNPRIYLKMMPPYLPWHQLLNYIAGAMEIILGLCLLFDATQSLAAWGIIILLILIFPANLYMYQRGMRGMPQWLLLLRLPLQLLLIVWAWWYT